MHGRTWSLINPDEIWSNEYEKAKSRVEQFQLFNPPTCNTGNHYLCILYRSKEDDFSESADANVFLTIATLPSQLSFAPNCTLKLSIITPLHFEIISFFWSIYTLKLLVNCKLPQFNTLLRRVTHGIQLYTAYTTYYTCIQTTKHFLFEVEKVYYSLIVSKEKKKQFNHLLLSTFTLTVKVIVEIIKFFISLELQSSDSKS